MVYKEAMSGLAVLCEDDPSRVVTCEGNAWHPRGVNPMTSVVFDVYESLLRDPTQAMRSLRQRTAGNLQWDLGEGTIPGRLLRPPHSPLCALFV